MGSPKEERECTPPIVSELFLVKSLFFFIIKRMYEILQCTNIKFATTKHCIHMFIHELHMTMINVHL